METQVNHLQNTKRNSNHNSIACDTLPIFTVDAYICWHTYTKFWLVTLMLEVAGVKRAIHFSSQIIRLSASATKRSLAKLVHRVLPALSDAFVAGLDPSPLFQSMLLTTWSNRMCRP